MVKLVNKNALRCVEHVKRMLHTVWNGEAYNKNASKWVEHVKRMLKRIDRLR